VTPGFRSTEFWHSAYCSALGTVLCVLGLGGRDTLIYAGIALLGASLFAYGHSVRSRKAPRPYNPPGRV
jgi:hypothetical protein